MDARAGGCRVCSHVGVGCDLLCDTVKIPGPIGPYVGYYTYQWYFNNVPIPPPNGTNDTLTPIGSGTYTLILTGPGPTFCNGNLYLWTDNRLAYPTLSNGGAVPLTWFFSAVNAVLLKNARIDERKDGREG